MEKMRYLKPEISILLPIHANYEKITFYTVIDMRESCYEVFLDSVTQTCEISFSAGISLQMEIFQVRVNRENDKLK